MLNIKVDATGLIKDLAQRISFAKLAEEVGITEAGLKELSMGKRQPSPEEIWRLVRASHKNGFFEILPAHGIPSISYDIESSFDIDLTPLGYEEDPPILPLINRPTKI